MSELSVKERITEWLCRQEFSSGILKFDDLLLSAATSTLGLGDMEAERFVAANSRRYWNWFREEIDTSIARGLYPTFVVKDERSRRISWFAKDLVPIAATKEKQKAVLLCTRPYALSTIDELDDRDYEALGCVVCRLLGARDVILTRKGNEGGVDFFASIILPARSHILFGTNGPLRIIGQCKKYSSKVQIEKVRGFITTMNDVKHQSPHIEDLVPAWFRAGKGPIVGWIIAHTGFQSGASSTAQNHGILLSDSHDVAEIVALSRVINYYDFPIERAKVLKQKVKDELDRFIQNQQNNERA